MSSADPNSKLEQNTLAERISLLYSLSPTGYVVTVVLAGLGVVGLRDSADYRDLLSWFAGMVVITLGRYFLYGRYTKTNFQVADAKKWEQRFSLGASLAGAGWGALILLFYPTNLAHQMLVIFLIGAVAMGSVIMLAPSVLAFSCFVLPILVPLAVKLYLMDTTLATTLSIMVVVYAIALFTVFTHFRRSLVDTLRIRFENDALIEKLTRTERTLKDAIESISDAFAVFDSEDRLIICNQKYVETYTEAKSVQDIIGMSFEQLVRSSIAKGEAIEPKYANNIEGWVQERVRRHHHPEGGPYQYQLGDGRWLQVKETRTSSGLMVGVRTDITSLKQTEEQIQHLAHHDFLTGLPNRRLLQDRLQQSLLQAKRNRQRVGVMVLDLDRFKVINDTQGHAIGDKVLVAVAKRLKSCVRDEDTIARQGGDEFAIILPELKQVRDVVKIADKILRAMAKPIKIEGQQFDIGASIGVSVYPEDGNDAITLVKNADTAMFRVKQSGRNAYQFFSAPELELVHTESAPNREAEKMVEKPERSH